MKNKTKKRIHFKDEGQDLTYVDIEVFGRTGIIEGVSPLCSDIVAGLYIGKAIIYCDMRVGKFFEYADPKNEFSVCVSRWFIERVEDL